MGNFTGTNPTFWVLTHFFILGENNYKVIERLSHCFNGKRFLNLRCCRLQSSLNCKEYNMQHNAAFHSASWFFGFGNVLQAEATFWWFFSPRDCVFRCPVLRLVVK